MRPRHQVLAEQTRAVANFVVNIAIFSLLMTEGTETSSMPSINANLLSDTSKEKLTEMVLGLNSKITQLHFRKVTNLRFYHLERKINMNTQYSRRDSLEITGYQKI